MSYICMSLLEMYGWSPNKNCQDFMKRFSEMIKETFKDMQESIVAILETMLGWLCLNKTFSSNFVVQLFKYRS